MNTVFNEILSKNAGATASPDVNNEQQQNADDKNKDKGGDNGGGANNTDDNDADKNKDKGTTPPAAANPPAAAPTDELDPEKVLAFLQKKGMAINSIDEIGRPAPAELTKEQKEQLGIEKRKNMLVYGLQEGKITSEAEYKNYLVDLEKPARDIAYEVFKAERLAEDDTLTEDDLVDEFKDMNFEHLEEGNSKRVRAAKLMEKAKAEYINEKYAAIEGLEADFDEHVNEVQSIQQYSSRIDTLFTGLPEKISFEIKDPNDDKKVLSYDFTIPKDSLATLQKLYKGNEYFALFSKGNMKDEDMQATILNTLRTKELNKIINEIATSHAAAMVDDLAKGRRGVPPDREKGGSEGNLVVSNGISDQLIQQQDKK